MSKPSLSKRKRKGRKACITLPMNGDHGTGTAQANNGTLLVPVKDSPNRMARRVRVEAYTRIDMTMRQQQAAKAIRDAFCRVESLSSGGPLKERVQASPKPDQTIDVQVNAQSQLHHCMKAVRRADRPIIEHVLWQNKPLRDLNGYPRSAARSRETLDLVANHLGY